MPYRSRWPSSREWRRLMSLWSCSGAICPNCPSSRPRKANPCLRSSRRSESLSSSSDPVRASGEWFPTLTGKRSFLSLSIWSGSASHSMPIKPMKPVLGLPRRPKKSRESFSWSRCPGGRPVTALPPCMPRHAKPSHSRGDALCSPGDFTCGRPVAPQQQSTSIEQYHQNKQPAITVQHTEVLKAAANHDAEEVGGKGDIGSFAVAEGVGEDDVCQKDRREGQDAGEKVAGNGVAQQ